MVSEQIRKISIFGLFSLFFAAISLLRGEMWSAGFNFVITICALFVVDVIVTFIKHVFKLGHMRGRHISLALYFVFTLALGVFVDVTMLNVSIDAGYAAAKIILVAMASVFLYLLYLFSEFFANLIFGALLEKTSSHAEGLKHYHAAPAKKAALKKAGAKKAGAKPKKSKKK